MATLKKKWDWSLILAGILLLACGLLCCFAPNLTLATIAMIAGVGFLLSGVLGIVFAAMKSKSIGFSAWGIGLFSGIVNIVCAIMLFVSPILFSLLVAVFVLWRGVAMIAEGVTVGKIVYR